MKKIAVFVSGKGTVLETIVQATVSKEPFNIKYQSMISSLLLPINCEITQVVYTNVNQKIVELIDRNNLLATHISYKNKKRSDVEEEIKSLFNQDLPDYIVMPGFTKILSKEIINFFSDKIINLHLTYPEYLKGDNRWKTLYKLYNLALETYNIPNLICGPSMFWITEDVDVGRMVSYGLVPFSNLTTFEDFFLRSRIAEIELTNMTLSSLCGNEGLDQDYINTFEENLCSLIKDPSINLINLKIDKNSQLLTTNRGSLNISVPSTKGYDKYYKLLNTPFLKQVLREPTIQEKRYYINEYEVICNSLNELR